jgi:ABC-type histidine transport system ATPase subunit
VRLDGAPIGYAVAANGRRRRQPEREIAKARAAIGMAFQSFNLFPHMTVLRNVMVAPMRNRRMPRDAAHDIAVRLLDRVGLADKMDAYPRQLSGGQQQRVEPPIDDTNPLVEHPGAGTSIEKNHTALGSSPCSGNSQSLCLSAGC